MMWINKSILVCSRPRLFHDILYSYIVQDTILSIRMALIHHAKLLYVILLVTVKHKVSSAEEEWVDGYSEYNIALFGFVFESFKVDQLSTCIIRCEDNNRCMSFNLNLMSMICELNKSTKRKHPGNIMTQGNTIYMEIRQPGKIML
jgi:hypothetical protein